MGYASKDKKPLKDAVVIDDASIEAIRKKLPAVSITSEQITSIATTVKSSITIPDVTGKIDKRTGYSLVADTEISKIHSLGADNQDLSNLVVKATGKGLSANDYTTAEQSKLAGLSNYVAPAFNSPYRTLLDSSGSHIAAKAANTYGMG